MFSIQDAQECLAGMADLQLLPSLPGRTDYRLAGHDLSLLACANGGFAMHASIGHLAGRPLGPWVECLLKANLFQEGPTTSVLGMAQGGEVVLTQHIPTVRADRQIFLILLKAFCARAAAWRERLQAGGEPSPTAPLAGAFA